MKPFLYIIKIYFIVLFVIAAIGCTHIEPWERGNLAKPHMSLNPHAMQSALRSHNYGSREAAVSSTSATGGGGCGCY